MKPSYRIAELEKIVDAFRQRAFEAERERDEMKGALKAASDNAVTWMKRALKAEIEIARRDAAASEPVGLVEFSDYMTAEELAGMKPRRVSVKELFEGALKVGNHLYTAAPPAVLPPEMKPEPEKYDVIDHGFITGYNQCRAEALALGAPPQKPVAEVEELSMLIRRLVHSLKNSNPDSSLLKSVPDYMQRKGYWKATDCLRGEHD